MNAKIILTIIILTLLVACRPDTEFIEVEVEMPVTRTVLIEREVEIPVTRVETELIVETEFIEVTREVITEVVGEPDSVDRPFAVNHDTLADVRSRGVLNCGFGNGISLGFDAQDQNENWTGLNVDFCRAVAAAVLGDSNAFAPTATTRVNRFPVLQSGEVDVLFNSTIFTLGRDTALGFDFGPIIFHDGLGLLVRNGLEVETLTDLAGFSVCTWEQTSTERDFVSAAANAGIEVSIMPVAPGYIGMVDALNAGLCDAGTSYMQDLVAVKGMLAEPAGYHIPALVLTREPIAPVMRHGDNNWGDIIRWTINCTIIAEELGITSNNVQEQLNNEDARVSNLLGVTGDLGEFMGLDSSFCRNIIEQVGNYGEIFNRHFGPNTFYGLERGLNALWVEGGLLYAPPFR